MKVFALFVAAFAYTALFFVSVRSTVAWWRGDPGLGLIDYALIGLLPVLAWIWLHYLSIFRKGCDSGSCALPEDREGPPNSGS
ncbi:MAG: hypothetical protein KF853_15945 [Rhodocyclaceae bacterium]|nr:hypothetical protein [Rhodocyclaceae bacterium]MBX3678507.1 hypothetical protein [Rhodocyclaceae bacterium]MCB1891648.1 hypothetical protein [Rhodocyclaceae bacterium]MCP5297572.1 hypothetical protein [Zoogloeaceae bacterium]MCW5596763.1 hypothetical protein [Rhodocyclaceae bacterium]